MCRRKGGVTGGVGLSETRGAASTNPPPTPRNCGKRRARGEANKPGCWNRYALRESRHRNEGPRAHKVFWPFLARRCLTCSRPARTPPPAPPAPPFSGAPRVPRERHLSHPYTASSRSPLPPGARFNVNSFQKSVVFKENSRAAKRLSLLPKSSLEALGDSRASCPVPWTSFLASLTSQEQENIYIFSGWVSPICLFHALSTQLWGLKMRTTLPKGTNNEG